nr:nucleotide-binding protein [Micromonospora sp. DSM 115978]
SVIREAIDAFLAISAESRPKHFEGFHGLHNMTVARGDERWEFGDIDEFVADYNRDGASSFSVAASAWGNSFSLYGSMAQDPYATVSVAFYRRASIERIFGILERDIEKYIIPEPPDVPSSEERPMIFIGHGRDPAWRDLKDHLIDKHHYSVQAYESGARAGHTIRDILGSMLNRSSFAVLVLTKEDDMKDGSSRARQNVVHEAGLFQGRLGFHRAIVLLEDGVEPFSNLDGVQYIGFTRNHISGTFGEVLAVL